MLKRPYTKICDFLLGFQESGEPIMEVDVSFWTSDKTACDNLRRTVKQKGFKDICVIKRGERIFVLNLKAI